MGLEYRNNPWFVSTHTTAAGVLLEQSDPPTTDMQGRPNRRFRLRGFAVSGTTAIAVTTEALKIIYGESSIAPQTTVALCAQPGANLFYQNGLMGIEGGYIAIASTAAHADGSLVISMWGD